MLVFLTCLGRVDNTLRGQRWGSITAYVSLAFECVYHEDINVCLSTVLCYAC